MARDPKAGPQGGYDTESYEKENPFARILAGELPVDRIYESQYALAFHDAEPRYTYHALVIPKGQYDSLDAFMSQAPAEQVAGFWRAVTATAAKLGIDETGYRLILNEGADAHREVAHVHVHLVGGEDLGPAFPGGTRAHEGASQSGAEHATGEMRRGSMQRSSRERQSKDRYSVQDTRGYGSKNPRVK